MEISGPNIKKFYKKLLIFQEMELSYTSGNRNPKKLRIFPEMELFSLTSKK